MNFEKLSSGRNIMQNLKDCVCAVLDLRTFKIGSVCDEHLQQQSEYMLSLLLRVRIRNRELQELEQIRTLKQNRKAKKVMNK